MSPLSEPAAGRGILQVVDLQNKWSCGNTCLQSPVFWAAPMLISTLHAGGNMVANSGNGVSPQDPDGQMEVGGGALYLYQVGAFLSNGSTYDSNSVSHVSSGVQCPSSSGSGQGCPSVTSASGSEYSGGGAVAVYHGINSAGSFTVAG